MADRERCVIFVSDEAWKRVQELADEQNTSLNNYIATAVRSELIDTRPTDVVLMSRELVDAGHSGEWQMYYPRRRRYVLVSDTTIAKASTWCVWLQMASMPPRKLTGAPTFLEGTACLSRLVEAIGTEWVKVCTI